MKWRIALFLALLAIQGTWLFAQASVVYSVNIVKSGWQAPVANGRTAGTTGKGLGLAGIKVSLKGLPSSARLYYNPHFAQTGWSRDFWDGGEAINPSKGLPMEAIRLWFDKAPGWSVSYRAHVAKKGWLPWVKDGEVAGTTGKGLQMEAIEIKIEYRPGETITVTRGPHEIAHSGDSGYKVPQKVETKSPEPLLPGASAAPALNPEAKVIYTAKLGPSWSYEARDGQTGGGFGQGKAITRLVIVPAIEGNDNISWKYQGFSSAAGWEPWIDQSMILEIAGPDLPMEVFKLQLEGAPGWSIAYRVHPIGGEWTAWARDGGPAGMPGKPFEAIEIRLEKL